MKQETKVLLIIGLVTLAVLIVGVFLLSRGVSSTDSSLTNSTPVNPQILIRPDSNKIATSSAKVTLVEFGDYQCPSCDAAYPIVKQILQNYSGKINFVFRNFPLPQHQNAQEAAEVAEASGAQGKYWQMHDILYQKQNDWASLSDPLSIFQTYAQSLGLNVNQFTSDVKESKYSSKIQEDMTDGNTLGVNATPTFYLDNVQAFVGVPTYDDLKSKIDSELSKVH